MARRKPHRQQCSTGSGYLCQPVGAGAIRRAGMPTLLGHLLLLAAAGADPVTGLLTAAARWDGGARAALGAATGVRPEPLTRPPDHDRAGGTGRFPDFWWEAGSGGLLTAIKPGPKWKRPRRPACPTRRPRIGSDQDQLQEAGRLSRQDQRLPISPGSDPTPRHAAGSGCLSGPTPPRILWQTHPHRVGDRTHRLPRGKGRLRASGVV